VDGGVDGFEAGDFDKDGGNGGRAAGDELDVGKGSEEGAPAALTLRVAPAATGLEAEGEEEAGELVEGVGRGDGGDQRDSLNHRFDCIVWE
jgi:hypothetical protein